MFTEQDVRDAYLAHYCEFLVESQAFETMEDAATSDIEAWTADNELGQAATRTARQAELLRLRHGQKILRSAKLIVGHRQVTGVITISSEEAPTVLVQAGHLAGAPAYREVTLVTDIHYLTPAEAAMETGLSESGWRNKAAAGDVPGALKKGKQWLIPRSALWKVEIIETIDVEFSDSGLYGDIDPESENIDVNASNDKFAEMLTAALQQRWPTTEINVYHGIDDRHSVNGRTDHDEVGWVGQIINDIWTDWKWVVYNA